MLGSTHYTGHEAEIKVTAPTNIASFDVSSMSNVHVNLSLGCIIEISWKRDYRKLWTEYRTKTHINPKYTYSIWCVPGMHSKMTSSNGNIFRVTGPLCREFTGHRWIPRTKASDTELWCFFLSAPEKRLSDQSRRRSLETPSHPLWRSVMPWTLLVGACKWSAVCKYSVDTEQQAVNAQVF